MRRHLLIIGLLLLGLGATAQAMELEGDFTAILAGEPVLVESEASKFWFDMEGVLNLDLYLSGLWINNTTVLSVGGLQFSRLSWGFQNGVALEDTFILAPNIIEFDDDLLNTIVFASPDTGGLVGVPLALFFQDPVSGFDLARLLSPTLTGPLIFRKKVVDFWLALGGVLFETHLLFADLGSPQTPNFQIGGIFEVSGYTPVARLSAATYIGARQGGECFGVCKPEERLLAGRVVEGLALEEEKLSLVGLKLLGGEHALRLTLELSDGLPRLSKLEVESHFSWRGLQIEYLARFAAGLGLVQEQLSLAWERDRLKLKVLLLDNTGAFSFPYKQLVAEFAVGKLEVENLLLLSPEAGLADRLTASLELESGLSLVSTTEFLGGGFYSQRLGLSRDWDGLVLRGDVTFRTGFMLGARLLLKLEF